MKALSYGIIAAGAVLGIYVAIENANKLLTPVQIFESFRWVYVIIGFGWLLKWAVSSKD